MSRAERRRAKKLARKGGDRRWCRSGGWHKHKRGSVEYVHRISAPHNPKRIARNRQRGEGWLVCLDCRHEWRPIK